MFGNSLKKEVISSLKNSHPELFLKTTNKFFLCINKRNYWFLLFFIVFSIFFILHLIEIPFLQIITITDNNIINLINQRTGNIVTMISITFAVIGFLISNLAIKESFTYNLLFKKSFFFPIVFIALSLIACFIILSTLIDSLPLYYQKKALVSGTYLILIVIFLIGYLFTSLVRFTNQKYILKLVKQELINEEKEKLMSNAIMSKSQEKLIELNLPRYSIYFPTTSGGLNLPVNHYVYDINLSKIREKINSMEFKDKLYIGDLYINKQIKFEGESFFYPKKEINFENIEKDLTMLNQYIKLKKTNNIPTGETREYVLQKLTQGIRTNEDILVENYFDMLFEAYSIEQQIKFKKK